MGSPAALPAPGPDQRAPRGARTEPPQDSRHRRIEETQWRGLWSTGPVGTLPDWARPHCATAVPAGPDPAGVRPTAPDAAGTGPDVDDLAAEVLTTAREATTLLELRASSGSRGVLAAFAMTGGSVAEFVRELHRLDDTDALHPVRGIRLARLDVGRLVAAAVRLVPPDREVSGRRTVRLAAERAFALADASRSASVAVWHEAAAQLGAGEELGVLRALARGIRGSLDVRLGEPASVGGRGDQGSPSRAFASWLLTDEGWVFVHAQGGFLIHVPVGRSAIQGRLLAGLTSHLADPAEGRRHG